MSRPLLGLILLNEDYFQVRKLTPLTLHPKSVCSTVLWILAICIFFQNLRDQVISSQPSDKRGSMMTWFDNLMEGIERNLLTKNRDRFTQNLSVFRRDINDGLKGPNVTNSSSVNDMMTWVSPVLWWVIPRYNVTMLTVVVILCIYNKLSRHFIISKNHLHLFSLNLFRFIDSFNNFWWESAIVHIIRMRLDSASLNSGFSLDI